MTRRVRVGVGTAVLFAAAVGLASLLPDRIARPVRDHARPDPAPAAASAPAGAPRLRGYLSPAPPKAPTKLVVYVTGPDGREAGYLYRGEFRPSASNPAVLMFSGPAEALAPMTPTGPDPPPPPGPAAELLAATNKARAAAGLPALAADARLDRAAQGWAEACARRGELDHFGPDGSTPWTRITAAGVKYTSASENAAWGFDSGAEVVAAWLSERPPGITGHRDNVLSRAFTHAGGGAARGKDGMLYHVADYAEESNP